MKAPQLRLDLAEKIIVDLFAGGGGMSVAMEEALGRSPDVAINHNEDALSLHRLNHPQTRHFIADVWEVDPLTATRGRPVGLLHLSPDCTHHSQARGGQPRDNKIRALSWVALRWAGVVKPDIITLENVKQIQKWGPLIAKRDKKTGRAIKIDETVAAPGEQVPLQEQYLIPDPKRAGKTWRQFVASLEHLGYTVESRVLNAADYGAPTSRERLYMIARRDGGTIVWPEPTHQRNSGKNRRRLQCRAASECIDWTVPVKSIFGRKKPLADKTLQRIAAGVHRYVLDTDDPFIVSEPSAAAHMMQANGGFNTNPGFDLSGPMTTITATGSQQQLVVSYLAHLRGNCDAKDIRDPLYTISAGGQHHGLMAAFITKHLGQYQLSTRHEFGARRVAAFLTQYYSKGGQWGDLHDPMPTITTKDRLALVLVDGTPYAIYDIGLRMLTPRELFKAQGFYDEYIIDRGHDGRRFSKATQVRLVGNSVSPPPAVALLQANASHLAIKQIRQAKCA